MFLFRQCLILVLLTLGGSVLSLLVGWSPMPWVADDWVEDGEITVREARGQGVLWVDARAEAEYALGHEPGAVHLTDANWDSGIMELMLEWLDKPRVIVVYCGDAGCGTSKRLAVRLRRAVTGAEVYALKGGWEALQK
jgi:rhodanese-related sulfurtransferase